MKIHIFGASGSGVTTTGKILAEKLNLTYLDSDAYFWETTEPPFTVKRDENDRNSTIKKDLTHLENWILGGSVFQWGQNIFPDFDLVVYLWIPSEIRLERLKAREFERYGNVIYTEPERIKQFENFMEWAADYDNNTGIAARNFLAHEKWLKTLTFPILNISGDLTIDERIELIMEKIHFLKNK